MRKLLMLGTVLAAVAFPTASHAQFTLGARLGYGFAMGDADGSLAMSDYVGSQIPIQLDVMYRLNPEFALGGYFSYGFGQTAGFTKDTCDAFSAGCSASNLRIGVQGTYAFTKASPSMVPWLGLGLGWETTSISSSGGSSVDVSGFEFLNLQGGANWKVSPQFSVGPYAQLSIAEYSTMQGNTLTDKKIHEWLSFGVMGKFDL